jgi:hypothetical protein
MPVSHTPSKTSIDLQEVTTRNCAAREIVAGFSSAAPTLGPIWSVLNEALADAPVLSAELVETRRELKRLRRDQADLLAAARASVAAEGDDAETDPLYYVRDELSARGELPPNARAAE